MKIHEYQSKNLLKNVGIPVPRGFTALNPQEALHCSEKIGFPVVLKAQVHVGGRGKAGAIKVVQKKEECLSESERILSMTLQSLPVEKLLVEETLSIQKEYYLGIILDRSLKKNVLMVSSVGGVDIEEVASKSPENLLKVILHDPQTINFQEILDFLNLKGNLAFELENFLKSFIELYFSSDANLAEINPLVLTENQKWIACDAKFIIDDNALFRQKDLNMLREGNETNDLERYANKENIPYVKLDGNVGIIGNGAGLVMTTMDEVSRFGGKPANFLDIGGGAQKEIMTKCLNLIYSDSDVNGIFINIFGGITRCDEIALSLIEMMKNPPRKIPVVLRLAGTRSEAGRELLKDCSTLSCFETMAEGASAIVRLIQS